MVLLSKLSVQNRRPLPRGDRGKSILNGVLGAKDGDGEAVTRPLIDGRVLTST